MHMCMPTCEHRLGGPSKRVVRLGDLFRNALQQRQELHALVGLYPVPCTLHALVGRALLAPLTKPLLAPLAPLALAALA